MEWCKRLFLVRYYLVLTGRAVIRYCFPLCVMVSPFVSLSCLFMRRSSSCFWVSGLCMILRSSFLLVMLFIFGVDLYRGL